MSSNYNWITPSWPAPRSIRALTTVRSRAFEDGEGVGPQTSEQKLKQAQSHFEALRTAALIPSNPFWLSQIHGATVLNIGDFTQPYPVLEADASVSFNPKEVSVVLTADCLPVLLCNQAGTCVAAAHAGWRGLAAGVIEATVERLQCPPATLMAWLGPAIGPEAFVVKEEVRLAFKHGTEKAFNPIEPGMWQANLYELARDILHRLGVQAIYGGDFCTYTQKDLFYSHRRAQEKGRMMTLIWRDA